MTDLKVFLSGSLAFLLLIFLLIFLMPVAITGGFFASKYVYCDTMRLCEK